MAPGKGPVVRARGLVKRYGELEAVAGIDLDIIPGECFGLLGPNGAGKTTTIRMICTTSPVTSGRLEVLGMDVDRDRGPIKSRLGVVPQANNLDPDVSVRENLLTYASYFGIARAVAGPRADDLLELMSLVDRAGVRVNELSGGMRRRVVIARALIHEPDLLVLDEPTTGLDPQARHLIWQRLRQLERRGTTLVLSTHYMEEAHELCDRLAIMDHGRILACGTPAELVEAHVGGEVVELRVGRREEHDLLERLGAEAIPRERAGDTLILYPERGAVLVERLRELAGGEAAVPFRHRLGTLEDVFLRLTGRELRE